jgi:hypothetical protein
MIALAKPGLARRSQSAGGLRNPFRVPFRIVGTVAVELAVYLCETTGILFGTGHRLPPDLPPECARLPCAG